MSNKRISQLKKAYSDAGVSPLQLTSGIVLSISVAVFTLASLFPVEVKHLNPRITAEIKAELPAYMAGSAHETLPLSQIERLDIVFEQSLFCPVFEAFIKIKNVAPTLTYEGYNDLSSCLDNASVGYELSIDKNGELIINIDDELPDDTQRPTERLNQITAIKSHILNTIVKTLIFSQLEKSSLEKLEKYE